MNFSKPCLKCKKKVILVQSETWNAPIGICKNCGQGYYAIWGLRNEQYGVYLKFINAAYINKEIYELQTKNHAL